MPYAGSHFLLLLLLSFHLTKITSHFNWSLAIPPSFPLSLL